MRGIRLWGLRVASVVAVLIGAAERGEADPIRPTIRYAVRDVGHLPTGEIFTPMGLNNRGDLVGDSGKGQVVLFADGTTKSVPSHNNNKVNDAGQTLISERDHYINNHGDRVGRDSGAVDDSNRATLITGSGDEQFLLPPWATASRANGINDRGQVVGEAKTADGTWQGFLYQNGEYTQFRGPEIEGVNSSAYAINEKGQFLLHHDNYLLGISKSYLYSDGEYLSLGILPGSTVDGANAFDLNEVGQIVGRAFGESVPHAFLYEDGQIFDLNDLIPPTSDWTLEEAISINDAGQILVSARNSEYKYTKFLLTPVPEPTTLCLFAVLGVAYALRRRAAKRPIEEGRIR